MQIKLTKSILVSALNAKFGYETATKMRSDKSAPDILVDVVATKTKDVYTVDLPSMVIDSATGDLVYGTVTHKVKVYGDKVGTFNRFTDNTNEVGILVS